MSGDDEKRGQRADWRIRAMARPRRHAPEPLPVTRPALAVRARAVGGYVPKLTKKLFEKFGFSTADLITGWPHIVGPELAVACEPHRVKWPRAAGLHDDSDETSFGRPGAMLVLRVDPARALEIEYQRRLIIDRVNAFFGYKALTEIKIIQSPLVGAGAARRLAPAPPAPPATVAPTSAEVFAVSDPGLQSALARLEASVRRRNPS